MGSKLLATINALSDLRPLIVGLGREGFALATYLTSHGFSVTVTDSQPAESFGDRLQPLREIGVPLVLGEHPLSLLEQTDILFVSPGVPLENSFLQAAQARNIPLSSETRLFCYLCSAPIIGITGSNGKTTTTTLLGQMIEASGKKTWVGGNIGHPLIKAVDQIQADHAVVLELSSFQLEYFHAKLNQGVEPKSPALAELLASWSPPISAILNITPNHLDRHPSMKHYVRAKRALINYQGKEGRVIMNLDNDMTRTIGNQFRTRTRWFSLEAHLPGGASLVGDTLTLIDLDGVQHPIVKRQAIKLRGWHNLSNILAACLLAHEAGVSIETMQQVIADFTGVPHRLQFIRDLNGVHYYNDSIATSPERLMAGLRSFHKPLILLAGGYDKHLPWEEAARLMLHKAHTVVLFGAAADLIAGMIKRVRPEIVNTKTIVQQYGTLDQAVVVAAQIAQAGDVVLLSPGCASFDAFRDFAERGKRFNELVMGL